MVRSEIKVIPTEHVSVKDNLTEQMIPLTFQHDFSLSRFIWYKLIMCNLHVCLPRISIEIIKQLKNTIITIKIYEDIHYRMLTLQW